MQKQKFLRFQHLKKSIIKTTHATIEFDIIGRGPNTEISYNDYATKSLNIITHLRAEGKMFQNFKLDHLFQDQFITQILITEKLSATILFHQLLK